MEISKSDARRSTRLSLQIPVVVTSLDPTCTFREECKTAVVNAHGCGFIVHERLKNGISIQVRLVSTGASKKARVVLAIPTLEDSTWLLGVEFDSPENFWNVENPPSDWCL